MNTSEKIRELAMNNNHICACLKSGGDLLDCLVHLDKVYRDLLRRSVEFEMISPKKFKTPEGYLVWRCPAELIPEIELGNWTKETVKEGDVSEDANQG